MRLIFLFLLLAMSTSCSQRYKKNKPTPLPQQISHTSHLNFDSLVLSIRKKRLDYKLRPKTPNLSDSINSFWVHQISNNLFSCWKGTSWDFNGHTERPTVGTIACGYFVTTVLRNMDLKIDRIKLATCPSLKMMQNLVGMKKTMNLSSLSLIALSERIKKMGIGVYIIGLDFHTGFIVNDGKEIWFVHSNYINRSGVTKESILTSRALNASKTRWIISLSRDVEFQKKWLS